MIDMKRLLSVLEIVDADGLVLDTPAVEVLDGVGGVVGVGELDEAVAFGKAEVVAKELHVAQIADA